MKKNKTVDLSTYMSALGKMGNKVMREKKLKEDPDYFKKLAKKSWAKRRRKQKEAEDNSK